MRLPFLFAAIAGVVSVVYRNFAKEADAEGMGRSIVKIGGFLVLIGLLGQIPALERVADVICIMFAVIVLLNDGYDIITAIGVI